MAETKREVWVVVDESGSPLNAGVWAKEALEFKPLNSVRYVPAVPAPSDQAQSSGVERAVEGDPWEVLAKYASETTCNIQPSWHGEKHGWSVDMMYDDEVQRGGGYGPTLNAAARSLCERLCLPVAPVESPAVIDAWKAANGYDDLLAAYAAAQDKVVELQAQLAEAGNAQAEWVAVHGSELESGSAYWVIWEGTLQEVPWVWYDDDGGGWAVPGDNEHVSADHTELCMLVAPPSAPEGT
jgi:hypothetical protein